MGENPLRESGYPLNPQTNPTLTTCKPTVIPPGRKRLLSPKFLLTHLRSVCILRYGKEIPYISTRRTLKANDYADPAPLPHFN